MTPNQLLADPKENTYDVIIIGGAMLGSSVAWFLATNADFDGSILVIEKDPTYEFTSTSHTNSCMRQQFSAEINIKISQFGADFVKNFQEYMGDDERVPQIPFHQYGYMYLADNPIFAKTLKEAQIIQKKCGAGTKHLSVDQIKNDYPFYMLDDIIAANHNLIDEGYFDGNTIFDWWKRSAQENGVEYITNEVISIQKNLYGNCVETITLKSGQRIKAGQVVNATGTAIFILQFRKKIGCNKTIENSILKKKSSNITKDNISEYMLCQIPSISKINSDIILNKYGNINNFICELNKDERLLENFKYIKDNKEKKIKKNIIENINHYLRI